MSLSEFAATMLPPLESELRRQVARLDDEVAGPFYEMLTYHMGWEKPGGRSEPSGKRIRPLLVLLSTAAWSSNWQGALPGAAAVELVHNFSLIHDDIQDNSEMRRGQPALWTKVGAPMAINAGDALFAIAHLSVLDLQATYNPAIALEAAKVLQQACLDLTRGQFLDIAHQRTHGLTESDYWVMVEGKTAALLAAGAEIGALLGSRDMATAAKMREFGRALGLAFQVQDDILGIWGDESDTGKSAVSDLVEGKSSLPVLYGLRRDKEFARRWLASPLTPDEVPAIAAQLRESGAYEFASQEGQRLTEAALGALEEAKPQGQAAEALRELARQLLGRSK